MNNEVILCNKKYQIKPFVPNAPFPYSKKTRKPYGALVLGALGINGLNDSDTIIHYFTPISHQKTQNGVTLGQILFMSDPLLENVLK